MDIGKQKPKSKRTTNVVSGTTFGAVLTAMVLIILFFDGVIPNLPIYDLQKQNTLEVRVFFGVEVLICAACQILFLRTIRERYVSNQKTGISVKYANVLHNAISSAQFVIIALFIIIVIQIEISNRYNSLSVAVSAALSLFVSVGLISVLAFRFWLWLRFNRDRVVVSYAIAMTLSAVSLVFLTVFMLTEMQHAPAVIDASRIAVSASNITNFELKEFISYLSLSSFISFWMASVLLLSFTRRKRRRSTFYAILTLPMVYYLGIFQLILSLVFSNFSLLNAVQNYTFDLVNSILTRPTGGVLFGIAFWMVARGIEEKNVSDYMKLSAFGIVLLSISNVDAGLFMLPYPPFGLPTISFMGLSSYLLFIGIYYSAISVSLNQKLRTSIQKSVEQQLRFVSKIGISQMEQDIQKKVTTITKQMAEELEEHTGVEASIPEDIESYINEVIKETEKSKIRKNESADRNLSDRE